MRWPSNYTACRDIVIEAEDEEAAHLAALQQDSTLSKAEISHLLWETLEVNDVRMLRNVDTGEWIE